ncbi:MAG: HIT family protein [Candidatus Zixiibacteriota bacterium]
MANRRLWAPWRSEFILKEKEKGCVFCKRLRAKDSVKNLIVYRGRKAFVILNKFPYNAGHAMVVPIRHVGHVENFRSDEAKELFELIQKTVLVIKKVLKPSSMNLGMNLGKSSGAGVPGHLHMHIVPRWVGDTNFMPVTSDTKVISFPLGPIYKEFVKEFKSK